MKTLSDYQLSRMIISELRGGCGDHSCMLVPRKGLGTNGGCRCHDKIDHLLIRLRREGRYTNGEANEILEG